MDSGRKGKRKKASGSRGAVTVFLIIVLVPCIIFTCLFGDISRVELSKTQAVAAGDLAMYSLLAHYDEELKEYYGLVASCQDIETFYDRTETYFTGMMNAKGISGEGSEQFAAYLESLRSGNISDFLQVEFVTPATVGELSNSAMGDNAAMIEDSIVEFMKYRGPYEIVKNLLSQLKKKNVLDGVSGAEKDEPIVEARKDYAEAESDMMKTALYCFIATKCYADKYESEKIPSFDRYNIYADHLEKIARDMAKVTELITLYYAGTDGIRIVRFPQYDLINDYATKYKPKDVGTKVDGSPEPLYCIGRKDLEELLKDIDLKIQEAQTSAGNIERACSGLPDPGGAGSDVNPAAFCMRVQNAVDGNDLNVLTDRGNWLMERYARLKAALNCSPYPEEDTSEGSSDGPISGDIVISVEPQESDKLPDDWKNQLEAAIRKIENLYNVCYSSGGDSGYLKLVRQYRKIAEPNTSYPNGLDTVQSVLDRRYEFLSEYLGRNARIGEFMEEVRGEFDKADAAITEQIANLDRIIYGGSFSYGGKSYTTVSLDEFKKKVVTYSSKRKAWGNAISGSGSNSKYARSERDEYNGDGDDEGAKLAAAIAKDGGKAVDVLKTRLLNIRSDMQDFKNAVQNFKYGGSQITKISGREELISAGRTVIPNEADISLEAGRSAARGHYTSLLTPEASKVYKAPEQKAGQEGNCPDLTADPPELYALLRKQFNGKLDEITTEVDENEKRNEEYKKAADEEKGRAEKVSDEYLKGKGGNISSSHGGDAVNVFTAIGGIVDTLNKILNGNGDELRDQLYVTEYIMDMFSYSTYNNEGQYRLSAEKGKYYTSKDFSADGYPEYKGAWGKESVSEIPENQSLTNQPVNASHNQMNLGEVEYILYGSSNIDDNLNTSYKNIFAIRETLNLVSGFQNFYSPGNSTANAINGIAASIMAATGGVVPTAATKCVLIGVLATMETSHDMDLLKKGMPVNLYKGTDTDWCYSISGDKAASFNAGAEKVDQNGIYYGDYLYFFLLSGMANNRTYSAMLLRIGDLIEANMNKMGESGFDLSKSRCYFSLEGEIKVKPLLLDLPIVNSMQGIDTETVTGASGWCTYKVSLVRGYS